MKKLFMIMVTLMCVSWGLQAQNRTISGTVVDAANNEPLIGATVMPVGGGQGAATDVDGNFTVSVPANVKTARFTYVGYKEQTVALTPGMKVRLESSSTNLQDVVVVAYGTANKESLTGSVAVVGAGEIEDRPVTTVTTALEGNAPGVQVNNSVSYPGSSPEIRIRGFNSFTKYQNPLYVVDGAVYEGDISDINPADVESMSVLKDAASCALYGNRGANGVVLITTKRAKNVGKVDVTLTINQGIYNKALPFYDRLNADQWMETMFRGYAQGQTSAGAFNSLEDAMSALAPQFVSGYLKNTNIYDRPANEVMGADGRLAASVLPGYNDLDWWDIISRNGYRQEYNVNASGATEKFNIFSSFGYLKENGYLIDSDFERYNGRLVANYNPVSFFKTGINLSASYNNSSVAGITESDYDKGEFGSTLNPFLVLGYAPIQSYYSHYSLEDQEADPSHIAGQIRYNELGEPIWNTGGINNGENSAWCMRLNSKKYTTLSVTGNVYGTAVLPYGFEFSLRANMWRSKQNSQEYSNNQTGSQVNVGGLDTESLSFNSYTFMQQLTWNHDYGLNNIDVFLSHENYQLSYDDRFLRQSSQLLSDVPYMGNFENNDVSDQAIEMLRTESYLGRARYNYDQKYFVEASIRRDGSSRFNKDNRWGTFWSVGASWILSKEKFLQQAKWINYLKLRLAYGSVGNDLAAGYYAYWPLYAMATYDKTGIMIPYQVPGENLKWEATKTLDVALEGSLFNDRFTFSVGYYNKTNSDLLYELDAPLSSGNVLTNGANIKITTNVGTMRNWGWELQFGVDIIRNANLTWNFNLDASFLKNTIVKLPNNQNLPGNALFLGHSIYEKYDYNWVGVDRATGNSLYEFYTDSPEYYSYNDNGEWVRDDAKVADVRKKASESGHLFVIDGKEYTDRPEYAGKKILGTALPTVYGSFGTGLKWKGINLNLLFTYSLGGKTYNSIYQTMMSVNNNSYGSLHKDMLKSWTAPSGEMDADGNYVHSIDPNGVPVNDMNLSGYNNMHSSRYLISNNYLTLKNLAISYDFPKAWVNAMKLQNINLGFSVDNLFIITRMKGMNPQFKFSGSQNYYYMPARVFNFSLAFKF